MSVEQTRQMAQAILGRMALDDSVKVTITLEPTLSFNIDELKALFSVLEREYIDQENVAAHAVVNKIMKAIQEHELARRTSQST